jgi:1,3-propanediol dehydrogenase
LSTGACMAGMSLASVEMGLHHGICHILGGSANVAHGVANCIVLPHALRFNLEFVSKEILSIGDAMGMRLPDGSERESARFVINEIEKTILAFGVPTRLRDVNVSRDVFPLLAERMLNSKTIANNPRPIKDNVEAMSILEAMW